MDNLNKLTLKGAAYVRFVKATSKVNPSMFIPKCKISSHTNHNSAFSKIWLPLAAGSLLRITGCILAFSTRGKNFLGPLLSARTGASQRETPKSY